MSSRCVMSKRCVMAGRDKAEKKPEGYNDVFAEILNVLLFEKDLAGNKELRRQFRDTARYYKKPVLDLH